MERERVRRGSPKAGPPSNFTGDELARLEALAQGKKRCPKCKTAKPLDAFWNDRHCSDGRAAYCIACASADKRAAYAARGAEMRLRERASKFGITVEHLRELLDVQQGLCAICRSVCVSGRSLAVDHDHQTGQVRGLLCANCNRALGMFRDSHELLSAAADYLRKWTDGAAALH